MAQLRRLFKHLLAAEEQKFADAAEKQTSFAPNPTRNSGTLFAKGASLFAIIILALATVGWLDSRLSRPRMVTAAFLVSGIPLLAISPWITGGSGPGQRTWGISDPA